MNALGLMRVSDRLNIPIYNFTGYNKKAFCVKNVIALDFHRIETDRECKALLSEEIGHVVCDAFYPLSYCGDRLKKANIQKQERKALDYACRLQVPLCELKDALEKTTDDYEIADILDVDIETLRQAVEYYRIKGLLEL